MGLLPLAGGRAVGLERPDAGQAVRQPVHVDDVTCVLLEAENSENKKQIRQINTAVQNIL